MLERSQDFLLQLAGVKDVYTSTRLLQGAWTPGISRIRGGYNPRYSGDILIEVAPGWHYVNQTQGDDQLARESYIPFPIIFFGQGVIAEKLRTPVSVDCIAHHFEGYTHTRSECLRRGPLVLRSGFPNFSIFNRAAFAVA